MTQVIRFQPWRLSSGMREDWWFSTGYLVTPADDGLFPSQDCIPMVEGGLSYRRWVGPSLGGAAWPDVGKLSLLMDDTTEGLFFDPDLEWARAPVTVWDAAGGRLDDAPVLAESLVFARPDRKGPGALVSVVLMDRLAALKAPLSTDVYGGTGGADGTSAVVGKYKPYLVGFKAGLVPVLVDKGLNLYQVHNGAVASVSAVREVTGAGGESAHYTHVGDVGSGLETAPAPAASTYVTDLSRGLFRAGPAFGAVLCDAARAEVTTAACIRDLLPGSVCHEAQFDAHAQTWPESIGWYGTGQQDRWALVMQLAAACVSVVGEDKAGIVGLHALALPDGAAAGVVLDAQIVTERAAYREPVWRVVVTTDAGETVAEDPAVLANHPGATEWAVTGFVNAAGAAAWASRLLGVWSARSELVTVSVLEDGGGTPELGAVWLVGDWVGRVVGVDLGDVVRLQMWRGLV